MSSDPSTIRAERDVLFAAQAKEERRRLAWAKRHRQRLADLQSRCEHPAKRWQPDPVGGSDGEYACPNCEARGKRL